MPNEHPILAYRDVLLDLVEGRTEPEAWLAWWDANEAALKAVAKPGWVLDLKPKGRTDGSRYGPLSGSQAGAAKILDVLGIPYVRSTRAAELRQSEMRSAIAKAAAQRDARVASYGPLVAAMRLSFPKFARFLQRRPDVIEEVGPPLDGPALAALSARVGARLPGAYQRLLRTSGPLWVSSVDLRTIHLSVHQSMPGRAAVTAGLLCFGEYWLESDGDQVLFDPADPSAEDDPPVLYYAHGAVPPAVRPMAPSFTEWVESLPRSAAFR